MIKASFSCWIGLICLSIIPTMSQAQDAVDDSVKVNTTVPLSEEVEELTEKQPGLDERIIDYQLDQHRVPPPDKGRQKMRIQNHKLEGTITHPRQEFQERKESLQQEGLNPDELESPLVQAPVSIRGINTDYEEELQPVRAFDSRFEIGNLTLATAENQRIITNSFSVMGIVAASQLQKTSDGFEAANLITLRQRFGLCPKEPYGEQPLLCSGTAFLIAPDVVVTARHNLDRIPWQKMAFLIGYKILVESGKVNLHFPNKDIYRARSVISSATLDERDVVLIKLDRAVEGAAPLFIETGFSAPLKESVYALGYPVGLPMKYITNASIKSRESAFSFYTTLDTFKGNSGSPVFSRITHNVIGVLVEGGTDFEYHGNCTVSSVCASNNCLGERVVNISPLFDHILDLITRSK